MRRWRVRVGIPGSGSGSATGSCASAIAGSGSGVACWVAGWAAGRSGTSTAAGACGSSRAASIWAAGVSTTAASAASIPAAAGSGAAATSRSGTDGAAGSGPLPSAWFDAAGRGADGAQSSHRCWPGAGVSRVPVSADASPMGVVSQPAARGTAGTPVCGAGAADVANGDADVPPHDHPAAGAAAGWAGPTGWVCGSAAERGRGLLRQTRRGSGRSFGRMRQRIDRAHQALGLHGCRRRRPRSAIRD